jgi:hypothetical protein
MTRKNPKRDPIFGLLAELDDLQKRAASVYEPMVSDILQTQSRDVRRIEQTLDGLLGFCNHDAALVMFKQLCRHYWQIDPRATASYVHAYRELWDDE